MKFIINVTIFATISWGCSKNPTLPPVCTEAGYAIYSPGQPDASISYQFDALGRVQKIFSGTGGSSYTSAELTYYTDSIVVTPASHTKFAFYLNNKGLADSSVLILGTPVDLRYYTKYNYNNEGYMISEREIFSQVYNGNILNDTIFRNYLIENGNLVKVIDPSAETRIYEYSTSLRPENNISLPALGASAYHNMPHLPFFGAKSKNLVIQSKTTTGAIIDNYSYKYDHNNTIKEMYRKNDVTGRSERIVYEHNCK